MEPAELEALLEAIARSREGVEPAPSQRVDDNMQGRLLLVLLLANATIWFVMA